MNNQRLFIGLISRIQGEYGIFASRFSLVLGFLALSACAEISGDASWSPEPLHSHVDASAHSVDRGVLKPDLRPKISLATPPLEGVPPRKPREYSTDLPERPFLADPKQLVGLDFTATKALLGKPARYFEQPPAIIWAYYAGICTFNVFFYPTIEGDKFRLLAYEVFDGTPPTNGAEEISSSKSRSAEEILNQMAGTQDARRCLAELLGSRDLPVAR